MERRHFIRMLGMSAILGQTPFSAWGQLEDLARLTPGRTRADNALWHENPLSTQFISSRRVIVAQINGPAEITMMHFAYARAQLGQDAHRPLRDQIGNGKPLTRELLLRIYWDDEPEPSVECPFVDFFCDPDDTCKMVNTAFVNVQRGFNAYFPMFFRKSARVELVYEGTVEPGADLARMMPCYSYICYRILREYPTETGYFHSSWRQESLLLGKKDYVALEARGKGKFVGWNLTVHGIDRDSYPVDENEKFYIDGETVPSVEFQGLEDSFGFSWGFPETNSFFPLTGYFKFLNGAAAYRFFTQDAISFEKSFRVVIGFGAKEADWLPKFSKPDTIVQFSSTTYWYQSEPHMRFPSISAPAEREPTLGCTSNCPVSK